MAGGLKVAVFVVKVAVGIVSCQILEMNGVVKGRLEKQVSMDQYNRFFPNSDRCK